MEDGTLYNIVDDNAIETDYEPGDNGDGNKSIHSGECLIYGEGDSATWNKSAKFEMVHKQWEAHYDFEGSTKLKDAMKRYHYKVKIGDEVIDKAYEMINVYNPLLFKLNFATVYLITHN